MFSPCNRYILIQKSKTEEPPDTLIALPEGVFKAESEYQKVKVLATAPDVRPPINVGKDIVVLSHMIEEVEFDNQTVYLVLENHVLGVVKE
jgi:co-chaperonin GroES (HSP10)